MTSAAAEAAALVVAMAEGSRTSKSGPPLLEVAALLWAAGRHHRGAEGLRALLDGLIHADDHLHAFLDAGAFDGGLLTVREAGVNARHGELTRVIEVPEHRGRLAVAESATAGCARCTC